MPVIDQADCHFKAVLVTGGELLGCRPLDLDGLVGESDTMRMWGDNSLSVLAERHFGRLV